jgi:hypothetical protein
MADTETLDRLYLEWSQFTGARTWRDLLAEQVFADIANSMTRPFEDPAEHANWCVTRAKETLATLTAGK